MEEKVFRITESYLSVLQKKKNGFRTVGKK